MKQTFTLFLLLSFLAIIIYASNKSKDNIALIGCTELNGNGCVCHTTERDYGVNVWVEGPDTLHVGEMGLYKMFLSGGPAEGGGYNVAGRFGTMELVDTFSFRHPLSPNELTQAFPLPFPSPEDTIYWEFGYVPSDSSEIDTIYSCGISLVFDGIPDALDRWNYGPKFPLVVIPKVTTVENNKEFVKDFSLYQNYPNPFNPSTKIKFNLPEKADVQLTVYDIQGKIVQNLINEELNSGSYSIDFNGNDLPSGIYFYVIQTEKIKLAKKMLLLK